MRIPGLIVFILLPVFCFSQPATSNFYKVKLGKVIDGDTFKVYLSCNYKVFCKGVPVRIKGINTPELKSKDPIEKEKAISARNFLKNKLKSGKIHLKKCTRDKYFRLLCEVFVDKQNVAQVLLDSKLAVPYRE